MSTITEQKLLLVAWLESVVKCAEKSRACRPHAQSFFFLFPLVSCRSHQFPGERRNGPHPENNGGPSESKLGVKT